MGKHRATRRTAISESIESDFYQTIIRNNLFAPLGTVLNPEPVPGANLKLLGTFVSASNPLASTAWIQDTRMGDYRTLVVTDSIHGFMLTEIQATQVGLEKADETITLKLETGLFLNPQRKRR